MKRRWWIAALVAVAVLPWVADRIRVRTERCGLDGSRVSAAYRVRIVDQDGSTRLFCGVRCAGAWIAGHPRSSDAVHCADCTTGRDVSARNAWFVQSFSTLRGGAPDAIRVFARRADAVRHAQAYGGTVLRGAERPFGPGAP